jgi:L-alanine-DL-glutamate epimerase-like enolase superfamily enzyme
MPGPIRNKLTKETFAIDSSGRMKLPNRHGLGITLDQDFVEQYRYRGASE